ncbi:hypothetical protein [Chromobacterium haemolyticum]|nr:hypothetical protein [Chromobacterium haemolyticum]
MRFTEIIIGWISDEVAAHLRRQGKRLHFEFVSRHGQPVHTVRRVVL